MRQTSKMRQNLMNRLIAKMSASAIVFLSAVGISHSAFAAEPLTQLKSILSPIHSLQASFHQKVMNEHGKVMQQSEGKMWIKKPGLFRWDVNSKDPHVVVSDGKQVFDYDAELSQVTVQKLKSGKGSAPIYFLTGDVNSLGNDFAVKALALGEGKCMQGSDACFELKPKASGGTFQSIKVGFLAKALKEIELVDHFGQRSVFTFKNLETNGVIAAKQFQFTPPKGVDVVRN